MVVATSHFQVVQRPQTWVFNKMQHTPSFAGDKPPTNIVWRAKFSRPYAPKPTARNMCRIGLVWGWVFPGYGLALFVVCLCVCVCVCVCVCAIFCI